VRFATRAGSYNHWWLKTDPDVRPAKQWVLAYHLKRWATTSYVDQAGRSFVACPALIMRLLRAGTGPGAQ
jgi:hypothetical protein